MFSVGLIFRYFNEKYIGASAHMERGQHHESISGLAHYVNDAFILVLVISLILLALVTFFMIFFVIRYHWKRSPSTREVKEPLLLEIVWTVIPTIIVFIIFYIGWKNFLPLREVPENAMTVQVMSRMWSWRFIYENGVESDTLRIPVGKPVKLLLTSEDVLHSLFVPDFRIKEDVVPGMETFLLLLPQKEGEYPIFCAEYCGHGHSSMTSTVLVMTQTDFASWYEAQTVKKDGKSTVIKALNLLDEKGCLECHSTDGSRVIGPTFKGIFGQKTVVISGGKERTIVADETYIKESILDPGSAVVKGYPNIMPSFEGELNEQELSAIIDYLRNLQ